MRLLRCNFHHAYPVSYTHLDVGGHFFQKVHRIIHEHIVHQRLQFGVGRAFSDELLLLAGHVGEHVGGDIPVSYTHLDVYKRQMVVLRKNTPVRPA